LESVVVRAVFLIFISYYKSGAEPHYGKAGNFFKNISVIIYIFRKNRNICLHWRKFLNFVPLNFLFYFCLPNPISDFASDYNRAWCRQVKVRSTMTIIKNGLVSITELNNWEMLNQAQCFTIWSIYNNKKYIYKYFSFLIFLYSFKNSLSKLFPHLNKLHES
jgi:hypothetical protein